MPDPAHAALPPRAQVRLNAAAHELRPSDAALAGGPAEFLLERKDEGARLATLNLQDSGRIDLHVPRERTFRAEIAASLPPLLARLVFEEEELPFDLARGPLVRAVLLRLRAERHALLITLHHIVSDGWSMGILIREMHALYSRALGEPHADGGWCSARDHRVS